MFGHVKNSQFVVYVDIRGKYQGRENIHTRNQMFVADNEGKLDSLDSYNIPPSWRY